MKLCKDCMHFQNRDEGNRVALGSAYCAHPEFRDAVFGIVIMQCINMRAENGYCGRDGKHFEAK